MFATYWNLAPAPCERGSKGVSTIVSNPEQVTTLETLERNSIVEAGTNDTEPKWRWISFALVASGILTICLSLFLSYQIANIHTQSVDTNQNWSIRSDRYANLGLLALRVNAPGNDVFDSQDVDGEFNRMLMALHAFVAAMDEARRDLALMAEADATQVSAELDAIDAAMDAMIAEVDQVFSNIYQDRTDLAGQRMATMERKYALVTAALKQLQDTVGDIQQRLFSTQVARTKTLQRWGYLIALTVVLFIVLVMLIGRFLTIKVKQVHRDKNLALKARTTAEIQRRAVVDLMPDAQIVADDRGTIQSFNLAAERIFGYTTHEALGQNLAILMPEVHERAHQGYIDRYMETQRPRILGTSRETKLSARHKDGKLFPITLIIDKFEVHNKTFFSGIIRNISQERATKDQVQLLGAAVEHTQEAISVTDPDGRLQYVNPAFESLTGYGREDAVGKITAELLESGEHSAAFHAKLLQTIRSGQVWSGQIRNRKKDGTIYDEMLTISPIMGPDSDAITGYVSVRRDLTEQLKLQRQLEHQASYDELTGLLNRRSFEAELKRAWEQGNSGRKLSYLLFMDLDQFKIINDTSGHAAGDQLLRRVSEILLEVVRANDIVCRLGGDEFGIILWDCPPDVAEKLAESIRANIESIRFQWSAEVYRIGISIGGLGIDPAVGDTNELLQLVDSACFAAKEAGRNCVHMVSGVKDSARTHRRQIRWVQRLRGAMANNRFALYGQVIKPVADVEDEPEHIEILLRLRDPATRKLIPPGAFLPAAERYDLSIELDEWVVNTLLDMLYVYQSFQAEHRSYWINLSGSSIGDMRFAGFLLDAMKRSPLPPGTLNFEITETAVMRSVTEARKLMSALGEMGCEFALDDFGSGLSSFEYLKKLPVNYLKIDGMFIREILNDKADRIFVKSIIDIAHALGIKTTTEFVENDEILKVVRDLGTDYVQGFAIGKPYALAPQFPNSAGSSQTPVEVRDQAG